MEGTRAPGGVPGDFRGPFHELTAGDGGDQRILRFRGETRGQRGERASGAHHERRHDVAAHRREHAGTVSRVVRFA